MSNVPIVGTVYPTKPQGNALVKFLLIAIFLLMLIPTVAFGYVGYRAYSFMEANNLSVSQTVERITATVNKINELSTKVDRVVTTVDRLESMVKNPSNLIGPNGVGGLLDRFNTKR